VEGRRGGDEEILPGALHTMKCGEEETVSHNNSQSTPDLLPIIIFL
jgi:hypothetical protein